MIKAKCDNCKNQIVNEPHTRHDVSCSMGFWYGDDQTDEEFNGVDVYKDYWDKCRFFKEKEVDKP